MQAGPQKMKAIVCDGFGTPDVLKVGEADMPKCNENEVLIKVEASAANRADTNQVSLDHLQLIRFYREKATTLHLKESLTSLA